MSNKKLLEDSEWLFTVLTALVKKEGGELKISDKDLLTVSKKEMIFVLPFRMELERYQALLMN